MEVWINDEIREDANPTIVCGLGKLHEIAKVTVAGRYCSSR